MNGSSGEYMIYNFNEWDAPYSVDSIMQLRRERREGSTFIKGDINWGTDNVIRYIAKSIFCKPTPCGSCDTCKSINSGTYGDLMQVSKPRWKVDDIRELIHNMEDSSESGVTKWVVIYNAHKMSEQASNAILKTLEEPFNHIHLSMVAPDKNYLIPTIRSRLVEWKWPIPNRGDITAWLCYHGVFSKDVNRVMPFALISPVEFIEKWKNGSIYKYIDLYSDVINILKNKITFSSEESNKNLIDQWVEDKDKEWLINSFIILTTMIVRYHTQNITELPPCEYAESPIKYLGSVVSHKQAMNGLKTLIEWKKMIKNAAAYEHSLYIHEYFSNISNSIYIQGS